MTRYRHALPQLNNELFLTDGGAETTFIFHHGWELPYFAAFDMLQTQEGRATLHRYYTTYAQLAEQFEVGLILESPTWRASAAWGTRLAYTTEMLANANRQAIALLEDIRSVSWLEQPIVISGCVGPRADGYIVDQAMSVQQAERYHYEQIATFADTSADMVCAMTLNYTEEAIGIAWAAERANMPVVISFTVETDGNLPSGQSLQSAIESVDEATVGYPSYYMINCAHPSHFAHVLRRGGRVLRKSRCWLDRIQGLRANASCKSHAELDEATELDIGDPIALGHEYAKLKQHLPQLNVLGGCCGTDHRHIVQVATACLPLFATVI